MRTVVTQRRRCEIEGLPREMLMQTFGITPISLLPASSLGSLAANGDEVPSNGAQNWAVGRPRVPEAPAQTTGGTDVADLIVGLRRPDPGEELTVEAMRHTIMSGARESSLIRECLEVAEHLHISRNELFVYLAYHALVRLEDFRRAPESPRARSATEQRPADLDGHF